MGDFFRLFYGFEFMSLILWVLFHGFDFMGLILWACLYWLVIVHIQIWMYMYLHFVLQEKKCLMYIPNKPSYNQSDLKKILITYFVTWLYWEIL